MHHYKWCIAFRHSFLARRLVIKGGEDGVWNWLDLHLWPRSADGTNAIFGTVAQ
jgi:hypothetical protein